MILRPHLKGIGVRPGVYKTQGYGENPEVYKRFGLAFHNGDDYAAPEGDSDFASHDGKVIETGLDPDGYGYYVKYEFEDNGFTWTLLHAHHKFNTVKIGDVVKTGQEIGKVGSTGFSSGPHVHRTLKQYKNGILLNADNGVNGALDPGKFTKDYIRIRFVGWNDKEKGYYIPADTMERLRVITDFLKTQPDYQLDEKEYNLAKRPWK
jgi:murein DD-endopeptidase MepM/ murein hydrolase activator NlpD